MAGHSADVMRRLFAAYEDRGVEGVLEWIDPAFEAVVPPELSAEPDVYRGHDGVRRWFAGFEGFLDDVRLVPSDFVASGDRVLVPAALKGRGAGSGIPVEQRVFQVWTVRGEKAVSVRPFPDEASARAAAGLPWAQ